MRHRHDDLTWTEAQVVSSVTLRADVHDLDAPLLSWRIGGSALAAKGEGEATVAADGRRLRLEYAVHPTDRTLVLTNLPSEGTFDMDVTAEATEADGSPSVISRAVQVAFAGSRAGFGADHNRHIRDCLQHTLDDLRVRPDLVVRPRPGGPNDPRVSVIDLASFERLVTETARTQPQMANHLRLLGAELMASAEAATRAEGRVG